MWMMSVTALPSVAEETQEETWNLVSDGGLVRGDLLFLSVATVATVAPALIS